MGGLKPVTPLGCTLVLNKWNQLDKYMQMIEFDINNTNCFSIKNRYIRLLRKFENSSKTNLRLKNLLHYQKKVFFIIIMEKK